jgi:transcription elongation factor SPT6
VNQVLGPIVWTNCASFIYLRYQADEAESEYLDNTRIHPEDYDIARKIAADALNLDEEDIKAETDEGGEGAVIRRLVRDDSAMESIESLVLTEYADILERKFHQHKRSTLETIRVELINPFEELRRPFLELSSDEIFTMLTGETRESLHEGMIAPVKIRRVFADHIEVKLDCGLEGMVSSTDYPTGVGVGSSGDKGLDPRQVYSQGQMIQARITFLNRKNWTVQLSFNENALRLAREKQADHDPGEWDQDQERDDKRVVEREKETKTGRAQRVIKHPLFRPFNYHQAEEFLAGQGPGDLIIRPSSKGRDHLAITWKLADGVYQHLDVLELDKDNEWAIGRRLKIGNYTYSDLDELIVNHVKAMAKKVDEMMSDDRYQRGSRTDVGKFTLSTEAPMLHTLTIYSEEWLKTYTEANPRRSMYAFCINPKFPGHFNLCFMVGRGADLGIWPVKVIPNAFELKKSQYPDMKALKNGFKTLLMNQGQQNGTR